MGAGFWPGYGAAFATIGAVVVAAALIWVLLQLIPSITWWSVKRLPLQSKWHRSAAGGIVAGSRRAYVLRIPYGIRIIFALGGTRGDHENAAEYLRRGFTQAERRASSD